MDGHGLGWASPGPRTFVRINDLATPPEPADGLQGDAAFPPVNYHTQMLHVWNIYLQNWVTYRVNVGIHIPAPWSISYGIGPLGLEGWFLFRFGICFEGVRGFFTVTLVVFSI